MKQIDPIARLRTSRNIHDVIRTSIVDTSPAVLLCLVVGLALGLRVAYVIFLVPDAFPVWRDTAHYVSIARNLLAGQGYIDTVGYWANEPLYSDVGPTSHWLPLYPFFLAGMFAFFGEFPRAIFLAQALLSSLAVGAVFLSSRQLFSVRLAFLAALLQSVDLYDIYYSGFPSTESFTASLLAGALLLAILCECSYRRQGFMPWSPWIGLAIILGVGCLHRSTFALLAVVMPTYILLTYFAKTRNVKDVLFKGATACFLLATVISPWLIRNYSLWDRPVYESKVGINLLIGNNARATGEFDLDFVPRLDPELYNELERDDEFRRLAWQWISNHPFDALGLFIKKNILIWNPVPRVQAGTLFWIGLTWSVVILSLACLGILRSLWNIQRFALPLLMLVGYVFSITVAFATTRYRIPLIPILAIFAANGISLLCSLRRTRYTHAEPAH